MIGEDELDRFERMLAHGRGETRAVFERMERMLDRIETHIMANHRQVAALWS